MKRLVMYGRTSGCPFISVAKRVFNDYGLTYEEIMIDKDSDARRRVQDWTGFLAVPTIVAAEEGSVLPYEEPAHLPKGDSPRGINRGSMITEPGIDALTAWLRQHDFIPAAEESSNGAAKA
jgi:glutaredoxin